MGFCIGTIGWALMPCDCVVAEALRNVKLSLGVRVLLEDAGSHGLMPVRSHCVYLGLVSVIMSSQGKYIQWWLIICTMPQIPLCCWSQSSKTNKNKYVNMYIFRERERKREYIDIYIYIYATPPPVIYHFRPLKPNLTAAAVKS